MTKREKVLTSITSVSLAIAIATSSVLCYHIAWNQGRFHPFHYKLEDIEVVTFSSLELERDPSGYPAGGTTWDAKDIKKIITLLNGFTATSEEIHDEAGMPEPNCVQFLDKDGNHTLIYFREEYIAVDYSPLYRKYMFYYGGPKNYFQPLFNMYEEGVFVKK